MTSPTPARLLPRPQLVAALLVGCVVVLLGFASGLGLTTPAAPASAPQPTLSMQTGPGTNAAPRSPAPATTPGVAYVAVPAPAPAPAAAVTAAPQPTVTSAEPPTSSVAPPSQPAPATGTPTPPPAGPQCPTGLLASVIDLLDRTTGGGFLGGLLGGVLDALGLGDLTELAALTPSQRAIRVRGAVLGPLRPVAAAAGDPPAVARSCTAALDLRITHAASR